MFKLKLAMVPGRFEIIRLLPLLDIVVEGTRDAALCDDDRVKRRLLSFDEQLR